MMTCTEIARLLKVSESTVRRWEKRGKLAGSPGYERPVRLASRNYRDVLDFVAEVFPDPVLRHTPIPVVRAAMAQRARRVAAERRAKPVAFRAHR